MLEKAQFQTVQTFGGAGGYKPFGAVAVAEIGLAGSKYVDSMFLNNAYVGGEGGAKTERLAFSKNPVEYISRLEIRETAYIDFMSITTNLGRSIAAGGLGGTDHHILDDIRVISIGGRTGAYVDFLEIRYIQNYADFLSKHGPQPDDFYNP